MTEWPITKPDGPGPHPGVVIGAEAYGPNEFSRGVQRRLADLGYASIVPDYYDGNGPRNTEAYDDYEEVVEHIAHLDFTRGARELARAVDTLRAEPDVDPSRIALWGYCTGATLAWLAACMRGDVAASVLFFPSQPVFEELGPRTPVHPIDLLWQLTSPTLFVYGDQDIVMPTELLDDVRARIQRWSVDAEVRVYAGAGHAFSAPWGPLRHDESDRRAWNDAVAFLRRHTT
jgi:carboxymethylenebutenolidase